MYVYHALHQLIPHHLYCKYLYVPPTYCISSTLPFWYSCPMLSQYQSILPSFHASSVVRQPWYIKTHLIVTSHLLKKTHPEVEILRLSLFKPLGCLLLKCLSRNVDLPQQRRTRHLTAEARQSTASVGSISPPRVQRSPPPSHSH